MGALLSKAAFARSLGVSPTRVTRYVADGLPVRPGGKIDEDEGRRWIAENVDGHRQAAAKPSVASTAAGQAAQVRTAKMLRDIRLRDLEIKQREGELVSREDVARAVFGRARFERDAWIGFSSRASVALAAELGTDPARTFAAMDRLVREHLADLSRVEWSPTDDRPLVD